ncbi:MAG: hypothetical protein COW01_02835 [Bdellovibrionales bacterium CG12_big_fil_rev_8_21_14_0_65_38_15]|nr:MAG: hypothetical protein COW79_08500 [Bdellovibrionales bacterium CG22_combo_CG10-13_8_21_14_all_38_13]PIQ57028.1 MAG: hypothetical protein COW01_02835 [Bdellovibrionales bacterium CG12_big_fil_rev_8_21_14_0_65_38_15]PIR29010.1 MAG: hypothetical protein COV38_12285 [Bdellovibrionales bacterium CG11_big_fil_rev_8_21_14_0_20_38_13]
MKKLMLLALASTLFVACDSMKGDLQVKSAITVEKKSGFLGRKRELITIEEGSYEAVLNPTSKTNINLVLKVDGKKAKIPFSVAPHQVLPEDGKVVIHAADSGQPYDLEVNSDTTSSRSGEYSRTESCVLGYESVYRCHTTPGETECRDVPSPSNCSRDDDGVVTCTGNDTRQVCHTRPGSTECGYEQEAIYGHHQVSYVDVTTYKNLKAFIVEGSAKLASFKHSSSSTSSHSVGSSACY